MVKKMQNDGMRDEIRRRVRAARKKYGWNTVQAAEFLGLSESGYKAREAGRGSFPAEDLYKLSKEFGVTLLSLITEDKGTEEYTLEEVNVIRMFRDLPDSEKRQIITDLTHAHLDATSS